MWISKPIFYVNQKKISKNSLWVSGPIGSFFPNPLYVILINLEYLSSESAWCVYFISRFLTDLCEFQTYGHLQGWIFL